MTNETKAKLATRAKWLVLAVLVAARAMAENSGAGVTEAPRAVPEPKAQVQRHILISVPDRKLALLEGTRVVKVYPVAVGAEKSPTPTGEFHIANRVVTPTYYHAGTVIAPGPRNPLGTRWMGLTEKHYAIHGTNAPQSIGKAVSHGCIRMAKADVEELFEIVRPGDTVEIRGTTDLQMAAIFGSPSPVQVAQAQTATAVGGQ